MVFKRSSLRYGTTPPAVTPYQKAAQVWDDRIGSARVQAHNWRLMAFACMGVSFVLLGGLAWILRSGAAAPFVVEVDTRGGVRAVGPAQEHYKPGDAQIAFHLARFVEYVRGLSIDPVVVRANWLKAYDVVTDRAALTLNDYARDSDPFGKVGQRSVTVEVTSVVRASDTSFQVRWLERVFDNGTPKESRAMTGLFSTVLSPPRSADVIRKNPLGIYIHAFNWAPDLVTGESK
jgi:type IV secretion system protein TrbF